MDDVDVAVALEIVEVEGQNSLNLMNCHRCHNTSVVDVNPGDAVLKNEFSPRGKDLRRFWEKSYKRLEPVDVPGCLIWSEAESVYVCRSRCTIPELNEVLRKAEEFLALLGERLYGVPCGCS